MVLLHLAQLRLFLWRVPPMGLMLKRNGHPIIRPTNTRNRTRHKGAQIAKRRPPPPNDPQPLSTDKRTLRIRFVQIHLSSSSSNNNNNNEILHKRNRIILNQLPSNLARTSPFNHQVTSPRLLPAELSGNVRILHFHNTIRHHIPILPKCIRTTMAWWHTLLPLRRGDWKVPLPYDNAYMIVERSFWIKTNIKYVQRWGGFSRLIWFQHPPESDAWVWATTNCLFSHEMPTF
jgi:hypothetical protein